MKDEKGEKSVLKTVMQIMKAFVLGEKTECTGAWVSC